MTGHSASSGSYGPNTSAVERVLTEIHEADLLTIMLAGTTPRPAAWDDAWTAARDASTWGASFRDAFNAAWRDAWETAWDATASDDAMDAWVAWDAWDAARPAACVEVVKDLVPADVYGTLAGRWESAVRVRIQIAGLSQGAEAAAAAVLDAGYAGNVEDLPVLVAGILA